MTTTLLPSVLDEFFSNNRLIGFDSLFDDVDNFTRQSTFPPYDIYTKNVLTESEDSEKNSTEKHTFISVACAGYTKEDLEVNFNEKTHTLVIKTKNLEKDQSTIEYMHKGIASRSFSLSWKLQPNLKCIGCKLENGLLNIEFKDISQEIENTVKILEIE